MRESFHSKIDTLLALILFFPVVVLGIVLVLALSFSEKLCLGAVIFVYLFLLLSILIPLRYKLCEGFLEIKCGLFLRYKIPYSDIDNISEGRYSFSEKTGTILSRDIIRVELKSEKYKSTYLVVHKNYGMQATNYLYISPKKKSRFMCELQEKLKDFSSI